LTASKDPTESPVSSVVAEPGSDPADHNLRAEFIGLLRGRGAEIGPLHNPSPVSAGCDVVYVDKFDLERLRELNPDVPPEQIVAPDVVCDALLLDALPDGEFDFLIASHVIEHVHNPLKALLAWRRVLRPGGLVLCIVPDGRYTFDAGRPLTPFEHLLWDYENEGRPLKRLSDLFHIAECNLNMHDDLTAETAVDLARAILETSYDTHFHVWSYASFTNHLRRLIDEHHLPFRIARSACDEKLEMLFLLEAVDNGASFRLSPHG
jgi:SAM-dependent methyltransferase